MNSILLIIVIILLMLYKSDRFTIHLAGVQPNGGAPQPPEILGVDGDKVTLAGMDLQRSMYNFPNYPLPMPDKYDYGRLFLTEPSPISYKPGYW